MSNIENKLTTRYRKVRRGAGLTVKNVGDGFKGLKTGDKVVFDSLKELNERLNTRICDKW